MSPVAVSFKLRIFKCEIAEKKKMKLIALTTDKSFNGSVFHEMYGHDRSLKKCGQIFTYFTPPKQAFLSNPGPRMGILLHLSLLRSILLRLSFLLIVCKMSDLAPGGV